MNGGQAEFVNVPMADLILQPIPEGVTVEQSILLTDAMCTAYFGLARTNLVPGDVVAVVGLGPIGLIGVELAFTLGASEVFAIDPVSHRRDHAEALGAAALDPSEALPVIMEKTRGAGVPRVFEASGSKDAVALAIKIAGRGSTASFVGLPQPDVQLPMLKVLFKDITIRAGVASVIDQWPHLIPLLQHGRLKAEGLFSHTLTLSEGAEAYRMFDRREDNVLKIMMTV
jgi:threonine dehydrogenase-like Zn-dependent dehydrogenase